MSVGQRVCVCAPACVFACVGPLRVATVATLGLVAAAAVASAAAAAVVAVVRCDSGDAPPPTARVLGRACQPRAAAAASTAKRRSPLPPSPICRGSRFTPPPPRRVAHAPAPIDVRSFQLIAAAAAVAAVAAAVVVAPSALSCRRRSLSRRRRHHVLKRRHPSARSSHVCHRRRRRRRRPHSLAAIAAVPAAHAVRQPLSLSRARVTSPRPPRRASTMSDDAIDVAIADAPLARLDDEDSRDSLGDK